MTNEKLGVIPTARGQKPYHQADDAWARAILFGSGKGKEGSTIAKKALLIEKPPRSKRGNL
jgi:hypothetical protein